MLNESVNPANGPVSLRIQLPVPKGRGLTIPVSVGYDSTGASFFTTVGSAGSRYIGGGVAKGPITLGGWSVTLPHLTRFVTTYTESQMQADGSLTCDATTGYVFTDPSGTPRSLQLSNIFDYWATVNQESMACIHSNYRNFESGGDLVFRASLVGASGYPPGEGTAGYSDATPTIADPDGTVLLELPSHSLDFDRNFTRRVTFYG